ncbi:DUF2938 domain-containing protein [Pseudoxanthomonas sp. z9]|uniref:DUF2938 domain-containing protein n=1 Tax=Pseudoxanthomonas sp. z9 TaxID=2584942 RepID=UPI001142AD3D|nr:DUF2938 domain-containing protein [Pseudoxanthomonas sp. z9]
MPCSGLAAHAIAIGLGATAVMDAWVWLRRRWLGVPALNYAWVGRWVAHLPRGRFRHAPIAATPPVAGEHAIGIIVHLLTGIAFAGILLALWGMPWVRQPTLAPALIVGIGSVAAPFLLMQPGMGAGVAARNTPHPTRARLHSLLTHAVFGVGLYLTAWILAVIP